MLTQEDSGKINSMLEELSRCQKELITAGEEVMGCLIVPGYQFTTTSGKRLKVSSAARGGGWVCLPVAANSTQSHKLSTKEVLANI